MNELLTLTLTELTERLRARRASPVELMDAVLERIEATRVDLNAFTALRDGDRLREEAREAEARIARGEARPLEGVPLGVKELEAVEGLPDTEGSRIFADRIADHDAVHVQRLKAAGAIVVGKTNAPEFGYTAITKNLVYGVTRSPWDLAVTPGGSSGGSSAALAGCVCPLVTASDGGGSIRIPASFTGAFGHKPTFGLVPRGPHDYWETIDTSCYGPLTKTVADGALYLDQVVGASPWDPTSLPHPGFSFLDALREPLPSGLRFGFSPDLGHAVVQSDVAEVVAEAFAVFAKLGHPVAEVEAGLPPLGRDWGLLGAFELASRLHRFLPEHEDAFGRSFLRGLRSGLEMTAEKWGRISEDRVAMNRWCAETFERVDLLVTPTVPYDPPPATGPFPAETEGRRQSWAGVASFTIPFNMSGHPAATVRAGFSRRGLPVGLQIVGPRHQDALVLRAAAAFERERPWHPHWPSEWATAP